MNAVNNDKEMLLRVKEERNWEFDHSAESIHAKCYIGDVTDESTPFLYGIQNKSTGDWINFKFCDTQSRYKLIKRKINKEWKSVRQYDKNSKIKRDALKTKWYNVKPNVDVELEFTTRGSKDYIYFNKPQNSYKVEYSLKTSKGLTFKHGKDRTVDVYKNDTHVFKLHTPFAIDKKGQTYDFKYKFKTKDKFKILTVEPVNKKEIIKARFPLVLDPAVKVVYTTANVVLPSDNAGVKAYFSTPKGNFVGFYADSSYNLYIAESVNSTTSWATWDTGINVNSSYFAADCNSSGHIHLVYDDGSNIIHRTSDDGFQGSTTITNVDTVSGLDIFIDSNDQINIGYCDEGKSFVYVGYSTDSGDSWTTVSMESVMGTVARNCSVCWDATNCVSIAWEDWNATSWSRVRRHTWAAGNTKTYPTDVFSGGERHLHPAVDFRTGQLLTVFHGSVDTTSSPYLIYYTIDTQQTMTAMNVVSTIGWHQINPSISHKDSVPDQHLHWQVGDGSNYTIGGRQGTGGGQGNYSVGAGTNFYSPLALKRNSGTSGLQYTSFLYNKDNTDLMCYWDAAYGWNTSGTVVSDTDTVATIDVVDPVVASAISISTNPTAAQTAVTLTVAWTEAHPDSNIFGTKINSDAWTSTTGDADTATPSAQSCAISETLNGNQTFSFRCIHTDDYGNSETSSSLDIVVIPGAPLAPTLDSVLTTSFDCTVVDNTTDALLVAPSVFEHAIYVTDQISSTFGWVQADGSLDAVTEVWKSVADWGTTTVTGLTKRTTYTVYSKTRNITDTTQDSANGTSAEITTISEYPVLANATVTVPTDGSKEYVITYDAHDPDDTALTATFYYLDASGTYQECSTVAGDSGSIDVTTTAQSKSATWNAGTDADGINVENSYIRVQLDDGDSNITDTTNVFDLDTKAPVFVGGTTLALSSVLDDEFRATWSASATETNFDTYELYVSSISLADAIGKGGDKWDSTDDASLGTITETATTITGLSPNTLYYVALYAKDNSGIHSTSEITTTTTTPYKREIKGGVYDDKGTRISGATVRLYNRTSGVLLDSTTSATDGSYSFTMYSSLTYQVVAYKDNYQSDVKDNLSGTIEGNAVVEDYNFSLDGNFTAKGSHEADIWMGRGNATDFIEKSTALATLNPTQPIGTISKSNAIGTISKSNAIGTISKTVNI